MDEADSVWDAGDVTDNGDDDNGAGDGTEKLMVGDIIVEEKNLINKDDQDVDVFWQTAAGSVVWNAIFW